MLPLNQSAYTVAIPVYEGPLALLLDLIERAELDITTVALAQVTDQYLAYVRALEHVTPEDISSFLVIASKLIQIKSEALLPRPPTREVGETAVELGAGRARKTDAIDYAVGIEILHKVGDWVEQDAPLFTIHANDPHKLKQARARLLAAYQWSREPVQPLPLFYGVVE
mgnify:CR=1 FL=1